MIGLSLGWDLVCSKRNADGVLVYAHTINEFQVTVGVLYVDRIKLKSLPDTGEHVANVVFGVL